MYGLIGYPLGHSFSKIYFTEKFEIEGIDEKYELFSIESLKEFDALLSRDDIKGLNVTIPYKESILSYVDSISEDAKEIGAVNVLNIIEDSGVKKIEGYNTDWKGFRDSLLSLGIQEDSNALILGSGGASKAVRYALRKLDIPCKIVSRDSMKGDYTYNEITKDIIDKHNIIVNTTPLGTYPDVDDCPDIPYHYLTPLHFCLDLIYNPNITKFMKRSMIYGAKVKNGLVMLHKQADYAWEIWRNS